MDMQIFSYSKQVQLMSQSWDNDNVYQLLTVHAQRKCIYLSVVKVNSI